MTLTAGGGAREFDCTDCGQHIVSVDYDAGNDVCFVCQWIRAVPDMLASLADRLRFGHDFARTRDKP
jgi:hypothetical protein